MSSLKLVLTLPIVLFVIAGVFFAGVYVVRTELPLVLEYKKEGIGSTDEWTISFGRDVRITRARIVPAVSGSWYAHKGMFGVTALTFKPSSSFMKGEVYTADISIAQGYGEREPNHLSSITFSVAPSSIEPKIVDFSTKKPVLPGDKIRVTFNVPMKRESSTLFFDVPGEGTWVDSLTYEHTVSEVIGGKTYLVKLLQGIRGEEGGVVTVDDVRTIASPGYVVASFSSISHEHGTRTPIEVSFNQPVDKASAEKAFQLSPETSGVFSWEEEKLIFTPKKLEPQKRYVASITPGVQAKFGLPSKEKVSISFVTAPEVYKLDVPYFKQLYSRSCEAASLRMALAYYGISTDDMAIIQKMGYNPRSKDKENNVWDDPHKMFVGDASKDNGEGYGVYGEPVALAATKFGRNAEYVKASAITPKFLAKNIREGYPIVLWGYTSLGAGVTTWKTPEGKEITANFGEHARLVVGVYGSVEFPAGFYLHDPLSGAEYEYWDADKLITHINAIPGVTDQAVVVK
ncbi:MAG: hypothetical protein A2658_02190 [Candidatus Yonathbacteria bacterium RIFCSPHIGHO2_01_FULL_44_19]|nr:MAG: hypothetical protein A2658_02190 [Candidatus Yonathbacteria bacterium RIFCSPHIGHO2_01_FULL_44_19]